MAVVEPEEGASWIPDMVELEPQAAMATAAPAPSAADRQAVSRRLVRIAK